MRWMGSRVLLTPLLRRDGDIEGWWWRLGQIMSTNKWGRVWGFLPDLPNLAILFTAPFTTCLSCNTRLSLPWPNCLFNVLECESIFIIHFRAYKCHKVTEREPWQICFLWLATPQRGSPNISKNFKFVGRHFQGDYEAMCISMGCFLYFM